MHILKIIFNKNRILFTRIIALSSTATYFLFCDCATIMLRSNKQVICRLTFNIIVGQQQNNEKKTTNY